MDNHSLPDETTVQPRLPMKRGMKIVMLALGGAFIALIWYVGARNYEEGLRRPFGDSPEPSFSQPQVTPSSEVPWKEFDDLLLTGKLSDCAGVGLNISPSQFAAIPAVKSRVETQDGSSEIQWKSIFGGREIVVARNRIEPVQHCEVRVVSDGEFYGVIYDQSDPMLVVKSDVEAKNGFSVAAGAESRAHGVLGRKTSLLCVWMDDCNDITRIKRQTRKNSKSTSDIMNLPAPTLSSKTRTYPAILIFDWQTGDLLDIIRLPIDQRLLRIAISVDEKWLYFQTHTRWVRKFALPIRYEH